ncbi:DUF1302 domain-containing protein [Parvibaculum sp.]|uniref:DUF1302 domain-containing protein n=1 Tax=Parvibaculum sp. TaxID=2024848 RepID=UPI002B561C2C|nr:DUF1302 domain-containing protein [Parvibaculum sp.]HUD51656.1 DUF1302 domain-containing protein [Parvibaculum sp.]
MKQSKPRSVRLAGIVAAGIIGVTAVPASAEDFRFGEMSVSVDTTLSLGVGIRTHGQDCSKVSTANGGCANSVGTSPNINTDDGEINFDQWDPYAMTAKVVTDIEAKYQNYGAFARVKAFYDYIGDQRAGEETTRFGRRPIDDAVRGDDASNAAGRDLTLLDAFVYGNFNVADMPLNLRAGKQVVNWGESLAIAGGVNQFLSVDLSALRTPGSEIKEALLPQEMLYASLGLPADMSLEAWVGLRWRKTQLDPVGTFFSQADIAGPGGAYLNLTADGPGAAGQLPIAEGEEPSNFGQYGVKLGYYADWLNQGTELGLYYVHYHSNLPFVDYSNDLPGAQSYRFEYPDGIKLFGASFATTLDWLLNGTAFSGEVVYQPDLPFSLSSGETLLARWIDNGILGPGNTATTIPYDTTPGGFGGGYLKSDSISGQLATISTLSTSEGVTRALDADLIILIANWGFQYLPSISQTELNALAVSRSETQVPNPIYRGLLTSAGQPLFHPDTFSHGYRLIANVQYNNALGTPWTVTPGIQFGQDFHSSAGPIGPGFLDNRKTLSLGVRGNYQKTWSAGVQWTLTRGNATQNLMDDRDFLTFDVSYAF